ncbi:MAG: phosphopyruvate hydratase, partial [Candidatus Omnitrophica bacterium CG1_02_41_171]
MAKIKEVKARQILDSRGNPTIEVDVILENGILGRASVPSGASTGEYEALELRDKEKEFSGKGVRKACRNVTEILGKKILGMEASQQEKIDHLLIALDGTENKNNLGANSILGISLAISKAESASQHLPLYRYLKNRENYLLPVPMMNILNGGVHADNNLDIQEFMIAPLGAENFAAAYRMAAEIFHQLKSILKQKSYFTGVGDEGGFAPNLKTNEEALELIAEAIKKAGYQPGSQIWIALDSAASSFFKDGKYLFEGKENSAEEMVDYYEKIVGKYPIISIEDGLSEDDWEGWKVLTERLGRKIQLV